MPSALMAWSNVLDLATGSEVPLEAITAAVSDALAAAGLGVRVIEVGQRSRTTLTASPPWSRLGNNLDQGSGLFRVAAAPGSGGEPPG